MLNLNLITCNQSSVDVLRIHLSTQIHKSMEGRAKSRPLALWRTWCSSIPEYVRDLLFQKKYFRDLDVGVLMNNVMPARYFHELDKALVQDMAAREGARAAAPA
jgi:hypothetical protein